MWVRCLKFRILFILQPRFILVAWRISVPIVILFITVTSGGPLRKTFIFSSRFSTIRSNTTIVVITTSPMIKTSFRNIFYILLEILSSLSFWSAFWIPLRIPSLKFFQIIGTLTIKLKMLSVTSSLSTPFTFMLPINIKIIKTE